MKNFLLLLAVAFCGSIFAQTKTVTFKPGPEIGKDAALHTHFGCISTGQTKPREDRNFNDEKLISVVAWTFNGIGCPSGVTRALLKFNELSTVPQGAVIVSAELKLFGVPNTGDVGTGNSIYPGSPYSSYGTNQSGILRVTEDWDDQTVTWNTQPTTTTDNQITIPQTTSQWSCNFTNSSDNLVTMIQDMVTNPETNFGFMLKLDTEQYYRSVLFASSNYEDPALWPELTVTYEYAEVHGCTDPKALNYNPEATDSSREGCRCCVYADEKNTFPPAEIPETPVDTLGTWAIEDCWFTAANIVSAQIVKIEISDIDESGNNHATNKPPHRHAYVSWEIIKEVGGARRDTIFDRVQYCLDGKNSSIENQPVLFYMSVVCKNPLLRSGQEEVGYTFSAVAFLRSTGISQPVAESKNNVIVYPNPFTEKLTVLVKSAKTADIALYSIEGTLLATYRNLNEVEIATGKLPAGVYVVKVTAGGKTESVTVVKK